MVSNSVAILARLSSAPNFIDLTGKQFGKWFVSSWDSESKQWVCICDCGSVGKVTSSRLNKGKSSSCRKCAKLIDFSGHKIGLWTVLKGVDIVGRRGTCWECRCECGTIRIVNAWGLSSKTSPGCGKCTPHPNKTHGKTGTPLWCMHNSAKSRAKRKKIPFDLNFADIVVPEFCPLLGIRLEHHTGRGRIGGEDNSPSLDRIFPEKGYTKDNTWVISNRANTIKNNASLEELKKLVVNLETKVNEVHRDTSKN
jgi:hypothetical protein